MQLLVCLEMVLLSLWSITAIKNQNQNQNLKKVFQKEQN